MAGERRKRWKRGRPDDRRCGKARGFGVAAPERVARGRLPLGRMAVRRMAETTLAPTTLTPTTEVVKFMDEPEIVACVDGPLLIRGDVELVSSTGEPIPRRRSTIEIGRASCRERV